MHELNKSNFNGADIFNKMATGPNSIARQIGVKVWWKRAFFGFVSICETNAYLAYKYITGDKLEQLTFREKLPW